MLVIIGHVSYDEIINKEGNRSIIPSGAAYTGAMGASLIQKNVGLVTRVGADYDMSLLTKLGINLDGVTQVPDGQTTRFTLNYQYDDPLERDFNAEFNVGNDIKPQDIPPSYVESATHVHIATMPPLQQEPFIDFFREVSPQVQLSIDTIEQFIDDDYEGVVRNFGKSDLLFADRRELAKLPPDLLAAKTIILKQGREGATYIEGNQSFHVETRPIDSIVDKTGSGDVLAGVFLANRDLGNSVEESLRKGCEIATKSIEAFGVEHLYHEEQFRAKEQI